MHGEKGKKIEKRRNRRAERGAGEEEGVYEEQMR